VQWAYKRRLREVVTIINKPANERNPWITDVGQVAVFGLIMVCIFEQVRCAVGRIDCGGVAK
jgi:hypothetical protein